MNKYAKNVKDKVDKHFSLLEFLLTGQGTPDDYLMQKLGIRKTHVPFLTQVLEAGLREEMVRHTLPNLIERQAQAASIRATAALDTVKAKVNSRAMNAVSSQVNMWETVKKEVPQAVAEGKTYAKCASALREISKDTERDWNRVAMTEIHTALENGRAACLAEKGDVNVFKRVAPDACTHCKRLYLNGNKPRIFKLSELMANGDNMGRKTADWKPVTGCVHPNCMCVLIELPEGMTLDDNGNMVPENK